MHNKIDKNSTQEYPILQGGGTYGTRPSSGAGKHQSLDRLPHSGHEERLEMVDDPLTHHQNAPHSPLRGDPVLSDVAAAVRSLLGRPNAAPPPSSVLG